MPEHYEVRDSSDPSKTCTTPLMSFKAPILQNASTSLSFPYVIPNESIDFQLHFLVRIGDLQFLEIQPYIGVYGSW